MSKKKKKRSTPPKKKSQTNPKIRLDFLFVGRLMKWNRYSGCNKQSSSAYKPFAFNNDYQESGWSSLNARRTPFQRQWWDDFATQKTVWAGSSRIVYNLSLHDIGKFSWNWVSNNLSRFSKLGMSTIKKILFINTSFLIDFKMGQQISKRIEILILKCNITVGWGSRICWQYQWRSVRLPTKMGVLGVTLNCIRCCGSSPGALENGKYFFIAMTHRSTLSLSAKTC